MGSVLQELLLSAVGAGVAVVGYFVRQLLDRMKVQDDALGELSASLREIRALCHERHLGPWAHHRIGDPPK